MATSGYWANEMKPLSIDYVYYLRCPIKFDVFYVGRTDSPKNRLMGHLHDGKRAESIVPEEKPSKIIYDQVYSDIPDNW